MPSIPFSRKNIDAGLVLADGLEERGQNTLAEKLRTTIDLLDDEDFTRINTAWWGDLYTRILRHLT